MIIRPHTKFYFLHQIPSTNIILSYKHMSFTILVWCLLMYSLIFLFMVFIIVVLCPISYSSHSLLGFYFRSSSSSSSKPLIFFPCVSFYSCCFKSLLVPSLTSMLIVTWRHFMLLDTRTSPSWSTIQGWLLSLTIVCALCLLFNQFFYIWF
jgi:hypothetical protein